MLWRKKSTRMRPERRNESEEKDLWKEILMKGLQGEYWREKSREIVLEQKVQWKS